jgi:hypothetical protein
MPQGRDVRSKEESIQLLLTFIEDNGRVPRNRPSKSNPITEEERKLGQFWVNWTQDLRKGKLPKSECDIIESIKLNKLTIRENNRSDKLVEIEAFVTEHKRKPNPNSDDSNEVKLSRWLVSLTNNVKNGKYTDNEIQLITYINDTFSVSGNKITKEDKLLEILNFCKVHKKTPSRSSTDPLEKKLSGRLNNLKLKFNKDVLDKDEIDLLNQINKFGRPSKSDKLREIIKFISKHNRFPSRDGQIVTNGKMKYSAKEKKMFMVYNNTLIYYNSNLLDNKPQEKELFEQILAFKQKNTP